MFLDGKRQDGKRIVTTNDIAAEDAFDVRPIKGFEVLVFVHIDVVIPIDEIFGKARNEHHEGQSQSEGNWQPTL